MKGDFSRDSFDPLRHYSRVLQQQGRVELDADGNERQAIQLRLVRALAADLIGPQGGPANGFALIDRKADGKPMNLDFGLSAGHYYVDGWLCENDVDVSFAGTGTLPAQPWWPPVPGVLVAGKTYLAYLDVWERHVCAAETDGRADVDSPTALREVALGGPDTASRAQVVWQLKLSLGDGLAPLPAPFDAAGWPAWMTANWPAWRAQWEPPSRGRLDAKAADVSAADATKPCVVSPQSRYRGLENQLYRVEIHRGGRAGDPAQPATFVWSRENGSVVFPLATVDNGSAALSDGWRDARFDLVKGDVVELSDDHVALGGLPPPLRRVSGVDPDTMLVSFDAVGAMAPIDVDRHAVLRRWDHGRRVEAPNAADGRARPADDLGLLIEEGRWLTLEEGITIRFDAPPVNGGAATYRTGDYWLIPARTALGDVLWQGGPQAPHGVEHHYAPMGIVSVAADGVVSVASGPALRFRTLVELSA